LKHYYATVNRKRGEAFVSAPTAALAQVMIERMDSDKKAGHLPKESEPQIVVPVYRVFARHLANGLGFLQS
jgi:hypothetical protein